MIKDTLWQWITKLEVVCRLTCTYLVRTSEKIARKRHRDQGVEYHLSRWHEQGRLSKHAVGSLKAYHVPTGKPGVRGNLSHDLLAGLTAAKLYELPRKKARAAEVKLVRERMLNHWAADPRSGEPQPEE